MCFFVCWYGFAFFDLGCVCEGWLVVFWGRFGGLVVGLFLGGWVVLVCGGCFVLLVLVFGGEGQKTNSHILIVTGWIHFSYKQGHRDAALQTVYLLLLQNPLRVGHV